MTADAPDAQSVAGLAAQALEDVEALREGLANFSGELERIPTFIRSLVEKELSQSTDLTIGEWAEVLDNLAARLRMLQEGASRVAAGGAAGPDGAAYPEELPDMVESLQALRGFLASIPPRMSLVPSMLLGPAERAEFLANIEDQIAHLEAVVAALPRLSQEAVQLALP